MRVNQGTVFSCLCSVDILQFHVTLSVRCHVGDDTAKWQHACVSGVKCQFSCLTQCRISIFACHISDWSTRCRNTIDKICIMTSSCLGQGDWSSVIIIYLSSLIIPPYLSLPTFTSLLFHPYLSLPTFPSHHSFYKTTADR